MSNRSPAIVTSS